MSEQNERSCDPEKCDCREMLFHMTHHNPMAGQTGVDGTLYWLMAVMHIGGIDAQLCCVLHARAHSGCTSLYSPSQLV